MKALACIAFLTLIFLRSNAQLITISGRFRTYDSSFILIECGEKTDTIWSKDGPFSIQRPYGGALLSIFKYDYLHLIVPGKRIFAKSGTISIDSNFTISLSDSEYQKLYDDYRQQYDRLEKRRDSLYRVCGPGGPSDSAGKRRFDSARAAIFRSIRDTAEQFIWKNRNNRVGANIYVECFATEKDVNRQERILRYFPPPMLDSIGMLNYMERMIDMRKGLVENLPAPDFAFETTAGREITLNGLKHRGKYLVIDFWQMGETGWRSDMDRMRDYFSRYQKKVEFLSINVNDPRDRWLSKLGEISPSWLQGYFSKDKDRILKQYCVFRYPTKIIIDPHDNIVQLFEDEDNRFYTILDSMLR
jgi:hypothetical protein